MASHGGVQFHDPFGGLADLFQSPVWQAMAVYDSGERHYATLLKFQSPVWQAMAVYNVSQRLYLPLQMFQSPVWQAMAVYVHTEYSRQVKVYVSITCMASHGGVQPHTSCSGMIIMWFQSPVWQAMAVYKFFEAVGCRYCGFQSPVWQAMAVYKKSRDLLSIAPIVSITCMASHGGVHHIISFHSALLLFQSPVWQAMAVYFYKRL